MTNKYDELVEKSLTTGTIDKDDIDWILNSKEVELLPLLNAVYKVRFKYHGKKVKIHIINNVQSGGCTEDCKYCAQSKNASQKSKVYPMKNEKEILEEAKKAFESDAYRYCMVFSGRDLGENRIEKICDVVGKIKNHFKMEVCVSAGFLNNNDAEKLKKAGVNRYNHNINTSQEHYTEICTSHEFKKRVQTIKTAKNAGLDICSGVIIGMGEKEDDIYSIVKTFYDVDANSIPINFFIPIEGHKIKNPKQLTPEYCLKVLSIFRLALPKSEIRAAGGREYHLRSLQAFALFIVDSVFSKGYLTIGGESVDETKKMIIDSGFKIDKIEY